MYSDYKDGYEAGRNAWKYDLDKKDNSSYNFGWSKGWYERQALEKANDDD